ncbi:MAG: hypothetical protein KAI41_09490, partial [Hyphomicrobiaceae bacterium]|nr:hypothetical protein [Hyphomicrobiaceae bacterium]
MGDQPWHLLVVPSDALRGMLEEGPCGGKDAGCAIIAVDRKVSALTPRAEEQDHNAFLCSTVEGVN